MLHMNKQRALIHHKQKDENSDGSFSSDLNTISDTRYKFQRLCKDLQAFGTLQKAFSGFEDSLHNPKTNKSSKQPKGRSTRTLSALNCITNTFNEYSTESAEAVRRNADFRNFLKGRIDECNEFYNSNEEVTKCYESQERARKRMRNPPKVPNLSSAAHNAIKQIKGSTEHLNREDYEADFKKYQSTYLDKNENFRKGVRDWTERDQWYTEHILKYVKEIQRYLEHSLNNFKNAEVQINEVLKKPIVAPCFGRKIKRHLRDSKLQIPAPIENCLNWLINFKDIYNLEGLFRVAGSKVSIAKYKNQFDEGDYSLSTESDPHMITGLLKLYLRSLPDPIFDEKLTNQLLDIYNEADNDILLTNMYNLLHNKWPNTENRKDENLMPTIRKLFLFLQKISQNAETNKMDICNLAIVFAPTVMYSNVNLDLGFETMLNPKLLKIVETLISYADWFFEDNEMSKSKSKSKTGQIVLPAEIVKSKSAQDFENKLDDIVEKSKFYDVNETASIPSTSSLNKKVKKAKAKRPAPAPPSNSNSLRGKKENKNENKNEKLNKKPELPASLPKNSITKNNADIKPTLIKVGSSISDPPGPIALPRKSKKPSIINNEMNNKNEDFQNRVPSLSKKPQSDTSNMVSSSEKTKNKSSYLKTTSVPNPNIDIGFKNSLSIPSINNTKKVKVNYLATNSNSNSHMSEIDSNNNANNSISNHTSIGFVDIDMKIESKESLHEPRHDSSSIIEVLIEDDENIDGNRIEKISEKSENDKDDHDDQKTIKKNDQTIKKSKNDSKHDIIYEF